MKQNKKEQQKKERLHIFFFLLIVLFAYHLECRLTNSKDWKKTTKTKVNPCVMKCIATHGALCPELVQEGVISCE